MNKILVTGSAGFVGFHLVNILLKNNFQVVGLDNINDYYDIQLKIDRLKEAGIAEIKAGQLIISDKYSNYRFIKLELEQKDEIFNLFETEKFDYVINLAAQAGVRYSLINPYAYVSSNIYGFLNILEACRHNPVKHFIYASSSSVYGANKKVPFSEDDNVDNPVSLYAATKKSNELFAYTYSHLYKIPATGLRFFTVYGPWGRPDMAYFTFTKNILEKKPIPVFNNGNMMRDFTYVDDIVNSILKLIDKPFFADKTNKEIATPPHNIYNIGAHAPVNLMDFIKAIENALNKTAILDYKPMQPGDVPATYADVSKLDKVVGINKKTSIETGIKKFVDWYIDYNKL